MLLQIALGAVYAWSVFRIPLGLMLTAWGATGSAGGSLLDGERMRVGLRIPLRRFVKALKVLLHQNLDT